MSDEIEKLKAEAEKYRSMKVKHAAAEKLYEASTRLKDKGDEAEAIKLLLQAIRLHEEERSERAEEFFEKAAPVLDDMKQSKLAAETYLKAAKQHVNRADHRGAIPVYLKSVDTYRRANLFREAAESLRAVAHEYETLSEPLLAAQHIEKEVEARLQVKDYFAATQALHDAADLYRSAGRFDESARCLNKAAEVLTESGNKRDGERSYFQAAEDLQNAADESAKAGDHSHATRFLLEAGSIFQKAKQYAEASKCHVQAAEEEIKDGNTNDASSSFRRAIIERLLTGELRVARSILDSVKNDEVKKSAPFKQSLTLVETFEKGDEERMNELLREITDFSLVQLCLAFGRFLK